MRNGTGITLGEMNKGDFIKIEVAEKSAIWKVEHIELFEGGFYDGKISSLKMVDKAGNQKNYGFLERETQLNNVYFVSGFEYEPGEKALKALADIMEVTCTEDRPASKLAEIEKILAHAI